MRQELSPSRGRAFGEKFSSVYVVKGEGALTNLF